MSPIERLIAAAEKIEQQIEAGVEALPWRVSELSDRPDRGDTSWILGSDHGDVAVSVFANDPDFALIVTAVNAMPAVARMLRVEAKTIERDPAYQADSTIAAVADQILGESA